MQQKQLLNKIEDIYQIEPCEFGSISFNIPDIEDMEIANLEGIISG